MSESADEELRTRLARIDPAGPDLPVNPATSPRAAELMERAMQTSTDAEPDVDLPRGRPGRRPAWWAAGIAAVAAVAAAVFVFGGSPVPNRPPDGGGSPGGNDATTLALSLPATPEARCRAFDVAVLRTMQVAFEGTVTATDGERTTLAVDRWFTGGDADRVRIDVPDGRTSESLGIEFRSGARYLVTATDGTVNGCGYSGPATAELESAFADAFPRR